MSAETLRRFWSRFTVGDGCWEWQDSLDTDGYGSFYSVSGSRAHRFSYETFVGPIPPGLQIDHLCRNRACVRPDHLEAVTQRENLRRGFGIIGINVRKTECGKGHLFDEANTYVTLKGKRQCRACHRAKCRRQHLARKKALV